MHAYVADARNLPAWAPAIASSVRPDGEHWTITQDGSELAVAMVADAAAGTIDIVSPTDRTRGAFARVLPNGGGSEFLFTLLFSAEMPAAAVDDQMATVDAELRAIRDASL